MAPGVFADDNHPSGAPDPEKIPQVWQVDPITGALSVNIPFATTPQGGRGPKIPFVLSYNSSSTLTLQTLGVSVQGSGLTVVCADITINVQGCELNQSDNDGPPSGSTPEILQTLQWAGGSLSAPQGPIGPWGTSGPFIHTFGSSIVNQTYVMQTGGGPQTINLGDGCQTEGPYLYTDENGATHDLNLIWDSGPTSNPSQPCSYALNNGNEGPFANASATSDGSALLSTTNSNGSIGFTTRSGAGPLVLYPDGTQFYGNILEDSNGNTATFGSDSEGRVTFSTTIPTDFAGQMPTGTYSLTTTGATGAAESYSVVVGTTAFGSPQMPYPQGGSANDIANSGYCVGSITCPNEHEVLQVTSGSKINVVKSVELPDGNSYTFSYDPTYATISQITFPTGGYVKFTWGVRENNGGYGAYNDLSSLVVTEADIYPGDGTDQKWSYSFPTYSNGLTSTITAPDGSYTVNTGIGGFVYSALFGDGAAPGWKVGQTLYYNSSGTLLKSINNSYFEGQSSVQNGLTTQTATSYYTKSGAIQAQTQYSYDQYANVTAKYDSPYYSCSGSPCSVPSSPPNGWVRETLTKYVWNSPMSGQTTTFSTPNGSATYTQAHIVNKPSQIEVTDGSGNPLSLVQYIYDQGGLSGVSGIENHDDTNYPSSMVGPRGNLTTEKHCKTFSGASCGAWNSSITRTYDLAGMLQSVTDPNGNTTSYSYTDAYSDGSAAHPTDAYVTTITHPVTQSNVSHIDSYSYFYHTGQLASHVDWNGQSTGLMTTYAYNDDLNRIKSVVLPNTVDGTPGQGGVASGTTTYTYSDASDAWTVQKQTTISLNGTNEATLDTYDGLGRLSTTQTTSDPDGETTVTRTYDNMSRLYTVTNPQRSDSCSSNTNGTTTFTYDALGEKVTQKNPDNSVKQWCYSGVASAGQTNCNSRIGSTLGIWVDSQDEGGNGWQHVTDALDHLVTVGEPNGTSQTPSMETDYTYDVTGNLTSVNQKGTSGSTARSRSFTYDGLSRLLTATNPESGTVTYGYDANGNVTSKTSPAVNQTSGTQSLYYCYDPLNRLTEKYLYGGSITCSAPPSNHYTLFA
jgi:YD repeat-containing protein